MKHEQPETGWRARWQRPRPRAGWRQEASPRERTGPNLPPAPEDLPKPGWLVGPLR